MRRVYIVQRPAHVTFYNELFEVPEEVPEGEEENWIKNEGEGHYLGFTDADWDDGPEPVVEGPWTSDNEARQNTSFYIE